MGLTGILFAIIVACWAAYLVPLAIRRHEEAARSRSIERFSSAMRVLSRRGSTSPGRMVVTPRRATERLLPPTRRLAASTAASADAEQDATAAPAPRPNRAAQRAAAARRRRVLAILGALTLVTAGVAALGVVPWWSGLIPLGMVVAFMVVARAQVRRASETYWEQAAATEPASNVIRRDAARVEVSHGVRRPAATDPDDSDDGDEDDAEPTVAISEEDMSAVAAGLAEERVVAVTMRTADGESLWDPLPVTLPTYVDKPVARRSVRTIDLGSDGVYSAGHDETASATVAADKGSHETDAEVAESTDEATTAKVVNG